MARISCSCYYWFKESFPDARSGVCLVQMISPPEIYALKIFSGWFLMCFSGFGFKDFGYGFKDYLKDFDGFEGVGAQMMITFRNLE